MVIMSVDLGKARTGIALSDAGENFAFPKEVITEYNTGKLIEKISAFALSNNVGLIVVGLPKNMDSSEGERAKECKEIAGMINKKSGVDTVLWDERCSTVLASTVMNENNIRGRRRKEKIDAEAAAIILESYLSFRKNTE